MDGSEVGELEFENFNAAGAKFTIKGRNVHPGYAKGKMVNSMLVANYLMSLLPANETPATTEGYEGFYHLVGVQGEVEQTTLSYIIRDHDRARFEERKQFMQSLVEKVNAHYGEPLVSLDMKDQYYNMREKIEPVMYVIDIAKQAIEATGVAPVVRAIRGGTDGAQLSFKGLPCPNIFAGGLNFHGKMEFVTVENLQKAFQVILNILSLYAEE